MRKPALGLGMSVALAFLCAACGPSTPEPVAADRPLDLGELTGSWATTITNEEVWQGRWELHIQGKVALFRGPDRKFVAPGLVEAAGRGVVVIGRDEACDEQRGTVGPGSYTYEVHGDDLVFKTDGQDTCVDRATVLTDSPWKRMLADPALPVRLDIGADPACASLDDGSAAASMPRTWALHNLTTGMVVVIARTSKGDESLLAQAPAGADVKVSPRQGGIWYVADLAGRCVAMVGDATGVTLRTGAKPKLDRGPRASGSSAPTPTSSSSARPSASGSGASAPSSSPAASAAP